MGSKKKKKGKEKKSWQGKRKKTALPPSLAQGLDLPPKRETFKYFPGFSYGKFLRNRGWLLLLP